MKLSRIGVVGKLAVTVSASEFADVAAAASVSCGTVGVDTVIDVDELEAVANISSPDACKPSVVLELATAASVGIVTGVDVLAWYSIISPITQAIE